jgi:hypothetical protein
MSASTLTADDPKSSPTYRGLKAAVIILGALLVLAFVMVVVGIGMRMSGHAPGQQVPPPGNYRLPAGSHILTFQIAQSRLVMEAQTPEGNRVFIFSTDDGHLIGEIAPAK